MRADAPSRCPLCQSSSVTLSTNHPGYRANSTFAILECPYCDVQFAHPRFIDNELYEEIYSHIPFLPGYDRYSRLADLVSKQASPLDWLASSEDMYWFVRESLRSLNVTRSHTIVEIGSGLGYLTYALREAGLAVEGYDLSQQAVADARRRFGDFFNVADATDLARDASESVDVIVMTEVIEHVPEPNRLLDSVATLIRPGGHLLLTTPNKSAYGYGAYWQTENPPVHLWWFSECTLRRLAQAHGLGITFFDFRGYASLQHRRSTPSRTVPRDPPFLDTDGQPLLLRFGKGAASRMASTVAPTSVIRLRRALRGVYRGWRAGLERSASMGVILHKPPR